MVCWFVIFIKCIIDCEDLRIIELENVMNFDVGGLVTFICIKYFLCDNFSYNYSVIMIIEIKNYNVRCLVRYCKI